jgi:hypothetical protein
MQLTFADTIKNSEFSWQMRLLEVPLQNLQVLPKHQQFPGLTEGLINTAVQLIIIKDKDKRVPADEANFAVSVHIRSCRFLFPPYYPDKRDD